MTKRIPATRKPRTQFEQVPLEAVKKIAGGEELTEEESGTGDVIVPAFGTSQPDSLPAPSARRKRR